MEPFLERLTWPEVEAAIGGGMRTAIVCVASSEQHAPHLPEATGTLLAEAYAVGLAQRLGDALVAPLIHPSCSEHHLAVAGSLTILAGLLMQILDAYLESLRRHGFERFVVFSSHGGNCPVLANWEWSRRPEDAVVIFDIHVFDAASDAIRRFGREDRVGPHAEVLNTSMMLHLHPALVPSGVIGPWGANAEMGAAMLEAIVDRLHRKASI